MLNNIISGYGEGGIDEADGEYYISSHNTIHDNGMFCDGQIYGSGISYVVPKPIANYTPKADDTNAHNNAALNLIGLQGPSFPFHNVVAWNVALQQPQHLQGQRHGRQWNHHGFLQHRQRQHRELCAAHARRVQCRVTTMAEAACTSSFPRT